MLKGFLSATNVSDRVSPANTIIVAKEDGDYLTIKEALQNASARSVILVYPGVYQEDNPLPAVTSVTVKGVGEQNATRIEALNADQDLFTSANFFIVKGFSLANVSGTGWVMNITSDHSVIFENCVVFQSEQGFKLNNASAILTLRDIFFLSILGSTLSCAICNNAGELSVLGGRVGEGSTVTTVFDLDSVTGTTLVRDFISSESTVTTILFADNGARIGLDGCSFSNMFDGLVLQGGCSINVSSSTIVLAQQDAVRIEDVGTETRLIGHALLVAVSGRYDLNVLSATAIVSGIGSASFDQLNMVAGAVVSIGFIDLKEGDEGFNVIGELHVGMPELGAESALGGGDSYTRGMIVYTYNPAGAVWTNVSTEASSASGSTFTFPAVAQHNAIYVASSLTDGVDVLFHYGVKAAITTAAVLGGGEIIAEYWNGAWVEFNTMSTQSNSPYAQYAEDIFERVQSEQVRYCDEIVGDWAVSDPMSYGTDLPWIRFRVATAVTTVPIFEQFKLHPSRFEVNADGVTEYFGLSRPRREVLSHRMLSEVIAGDTPLNTSIAYANGITIAHIANNFTNALVKAVGLTIEVAEGIDTSCPMVFEVVWLPSTNNAGNVELELTSASIEIGDLLDGTITSTSTAVVQVVPANDINVIRKAEFLVDISKLVPGEIIAAKLSRDATGGNDPPDTLVGNIAVSSIAAYGRFWR